MKRDVEKELLRWKESSDRSPLLVRGARQVGKSFLIEWFGKNFFENLAVINFEMKTEFSSAFEKSLDPQDIIPQLERFLKISIIPGKTLLFLDEIQVCPRAIMSLRYFKERFPQLHVIGAGSLLEFVIADEDFSFPVGRVQFLYIKPLSLREFFYASGHERIVQAIEGASLKKPLDLEVHDFILKETKPYFLVGGMPKSVDTFLKENSYLQSQYVQESILTTYQSDFAKYATKAQHKYLKILFEKAPRLVGKHLKYSKVDPEARSRELKVACEQLSLAGLIYRVHATTASGLPLKAEVKENKFKLIFLDIGLMQNGLRLAPEAFLTEDFFQINGGDLAEQFVGQEILAYGDCYRHQELFFWEREKVHSSAQVDYVIQVGAKIFPVEVKAGKGGHLQSLKVFMEEKKSQFGLQISQAPLIFNNKILSVPFYMIEQIPRLIREVLQGA